MGEGEGGMFQENSIETCILSRVEREVGGGIRMGNTCKPMADSFQCMTKPTTIKNKNKNKKRNEQATIPALEELTPLSKDDVYPTNNKQTTQAL